MARKKTFDREEALEKAMQVFWRKGYEATSIQDLVDHMGINRGSLYDTFTDKHSLFLEAIEHYDSCVVSEALDHLEVPGSPKAAIAHFFHDLVDQAMADRDRRGCLVTNTAVELSPHDPETSGRILANLRRIEDTLYRKLALAQAAGEIDANQDLRALAQFLLSSLQGLRVMSKTQPDPSVLHTVANLVLSVLDQPPS